MSQISTKLTIFNEISTKHFVFPRLPKFQKFRFRFREKLDEAIKKRDAKMFDSFCEVLGTLAPDNNIILDGRHGESLSAAEKALWKGKVPRMPADRFLRESDLLPTALGAVLLPALNTPFANNLVAGDGVIAKRPSRFQLGVVTKRDGVARECRMAEFVKALLDDEAKVLFTKLVNEIVLEVPFSGLPDGEQNPIVVAKCDFWSDVLRSAFVALVRPADLDWQHPKPPDPRAQVDRKFHKDFF